MITFEIFGKNLLGAVAERARALKKETDAKLIEAGRRFSESVGNLSKTKYLSGGSKEVLHVRTGNLRSSIRSRVTPDVSGFTIGWGTSVPYGPIHEYGGIIPARGKKGKSWRMPQRSFLRRPLDEKIGEFKDAVAEIVGDLDKRLFGGL